MTRWLAVRTATDQRPLAVAAGPFQPAVRAFVLFDTGQGLEYGEVRREAREGETAPPGSARMTRLATEADVRQETRNLELSERAMTDSSALIRELGLPMRLIRARYQWDRSRITFFYVSEGRVDFRALVKALAARLRTRIQLLQVGARDAARLLGGIGPCGRELCCTSWMTEFSSVTAGMAQAQALVLNPTRYSGVCGKLMCCLRFEYSAYAEARSDYPAVGAAVETSDGAGKVSGWNVPAGSVVVRLDGGVEKAYSPEGVHRALTVGCAVAEGGSCRGGCSTRGSQGAPPD